MAAAAAAVDRAVEKFLILGTKLLMKMNFSTIEERGTLLYYSESCLIQSGMVAQLGKQFGLFLFTRVSVKISSSTVFT